MANIRICLMRYGLAIIWVQSVITTQSKSETEVMSFDARLFSLHTQFIPNLSLSKMSECRFCFKEFRLDTDNASICKCSGFLCAECFGKQINMKRPWLNNPSCNTTLWTLLVSLGVPYWTLIIPLRQPSLSWSWYHRTVVQQTKFH